MMMKEISLHVLDIVQNSIVAGATLITISVNEDHKADTLKVSVEDNGSGMDEKMLESVISPFTTSRTTRKVGLGIPMFKAGAEATGGGFEIRSKKGEGTYIAAIYRISHIDRPPLGNMTETVLSTVICNEQIDFVYIYIVNDKTFTFDTREVKGILGEGISLQVPDVFAWLKEHLEESTNEINGGVKI